MRVSPSAEAAWPPAPTSISAGNELVPLSSSGEFEQADRLFTKRKFAEAIIQYRSTLAAHGNAVDAPTAHMRLIDSLEACGMRDEAKEEAVKLAERLTAFPAAASHIHHVRGKLEAWHLDYMAAYKYFESGLALTNPTESIYYFLASDLASTGARVGRPDLTQYWSTLALSSGQVSALHTTLLSYAGLGSFILGDLDKAEHYWRDRLEIARRGDDVPNYASTLALLGRFYAESGDSKHGIYLGKQAVSIYPKDRVGHCRLMLASTLSRAGHYRQALRIFKAALEHVPPPQRREDIRHRFTIKYHWAMAAAGMGDFVQAWRLYEALGDGLSQVIDIPQKSSLGAWLAAGLGNPHAIDLLRDAYRDIDTSTMHEAAVRDFVKNIACGAVLVHDADLATRCAERMLNQPQSPSNLSGSWFYMGEAATIRGDLEAARHAYEQSLAVGVKNPAVEKAKTRLRELV